MVPMMQTGPGGMPAPVGGPAMVSCALDNMPFRYQLSEDDLRQTFQKWGLIQGIQVSREGPREVGVVHFNDSIDASDAQRQLNGHICNLGPGASGILVVVPGGPEQLGGAPVGPPMQGQPMLGPPGSAPPPPQQMMGGAPPMGGPGMAPGPSGAMPKSGGVPAPAKGGDAKGFGKGGDGKGFVQVAPVPPRPVWCCKIMIQAESLHPDFPTAQKIVGADNVNVGHLREHSKCDIELRGKGSGTLDPATGQEAPEPQNLWIASDSVENGRAALEMSQDLLKSVYEEHQVWCTKHGLMHPSFIEPQVIENPEIAPPSAGAPPQQLSGPPAGLPAGPPGGDFYPEASAGGYQAMKGGKGFHGKGPY